MPTPTQTRYVIRCTGAPDEDTRLPLWWSNDHGWGDRAGATLFPPEAPTTLTLPLEGEWVPVPL